MAIYRDQGDKIISAGVLQGLEQDSARRRAEQDANLKRLLIGENVDRAKALAAEQGLKPGKFSMSAGEGHVNINPEPGEVAMLRDAIQQQKSLRAAAVPDFDITDPSAVIPTRNSAEELMQAQQGFRAMRETGRGIATDLEKANTLDRLGSFNLPIVGSVGTQRGREIDAKIGDLLMQGKNLEKLGALQAPEIKLMERMQGSLTGMGSLLQDKKDVAARLQELIERGASRVKETALTRGYTPRQGALESDILPEGLRKQPMQAPPPADPRRARLDELRAKYKK